MFSSLRSIAKVFFAGMVFFSAMCAEGAIVTSPSEFRSSYGLCSGQNPSQWNMCVGIAQFPNGNIYIGEWLNGIRSGNGQIRVVAIGESDNNSIRFKSPGHYLGKFSGNKLNGHGVILLDSGERYEGEFFDNILRGRADNYMVVSSVEEFKSPYRLCSGQDVSTWSNCVGSYKYPNGNTYIGEWHSGMRDGYGQLRIVAIGNSDGNSIRASSPAYYVGQFQNTRLNGHGVIIYDNGDRAGGQFKDNIMITTSAGDVPSTAPPSPSSQSPSTIASTDKSQVATPAKQPKVMVGTGFFVSPNGHFVTNWHVVEGAKLVMIKNYDQKEIEAQVIAKDVVNDLAVLKIDAPTKSWLHIISDSSKVKKGTEVATVGFPQINTQGFEPKVTTGVISSLSGIDNDPRDFQISVPIQHGNSGGPLITHRGLVVGVVSSKLDAMYMLKNTGAIPENVNYAVKSNYLLELLRSYQVRAKIDTKGLSSDIDTPDLTELVEKSTVLIFAVTE